MIHPIPTKKKRLCGGGHKTTLPDMKEDLVAWIEGLRAHNWRVTRTSIQSKVLELAQAAGDD